MASTNKTTHLELSQYTANDKPTYLVDYNGDMAKIDTAVYGNTTKATQNETNIGTMSNLNTTEKSSLVGAINEVNTQVGTNTTAIGNLNISTSANTGNIGTMANLDTTDKSSLVNAINEVKEDSDNNFNKFNFTTFNSYGGGDMTTTTGTIYSAASYPSTITVASNSDYSLLKVYGFAGITSSNSRTGVITLPNAIPSLYRPSSDITINQPGVVNDPDSTYPSLTYCSLTLKTTGDIDINYTKGNAGERLITINLIPFVIFVKDFGDTPQAE